MYKHAADPLVLVIGLVFLGAATYWLLYLTGVTPASDARYAVPVVLVVAGVAGLVSAITRERRQTGQRDHT
jgi:multidrug resistance efflux pump